METDVVDKIKLCMQEHDITLENLADELCVNSDFLQNVLDKKYIFLDALDVEYVHEALLRIIESK